VTDYQHLLVERDGPVLVVTLNRPEVLNAFDAHTNRELQAVFRAFEEDAESRVAIVTGAGRAFSAGTDLRYSATLDEPGLAEYVRLDYETKNHIAAVGKPVIAATHGYAVGGGLELALACDMRIATPETQFAFGEARLGTVPGAGGLQRLRAVVGVGVAMEWALSGRRIAGEEAYRRGLVNRLTDGDVLAAAKAWATDLAEVDPFAAKLTKAALNPRPALDDFTRVYYELANVACGRTAAFKTESGRFSGRGSSTTEEAT